VVLEKPVLKNCIDLVNATEYVLSTFQGVF
jgi:hypothetical protein